MSICPTKYTIQFIVLKDEQMIVHMVFYECLINAGEKSGHQIGRRLHRLVRCKYPHSPLELSRAFPRRNPKEVGIDVNSTDSQWRSNHGGAGAASPRKFFAITSFAGRT